MGKTRGEGFSKKTESTSSERAFLFGKCVG